jgi:hypothetical protein
MDFNRPERCQQQRTGWEDRHSKFYDISDNLAWHHHVATILEPLLPLR